MKSDPIVATERRRLPEILLGLASAGSAALLFYEGRGFTFFRDEWYFIMYRAGHSLDTFLSPHADHLVVVPVFVYKTLFKTAGLADYTPYRLTGIAFHILCAALLFVFARRRVGGIAAVAPAALLLFLGPAWMNLLWPFQIAFLGSLAAGIAMLLVLERGDRIGDVAASGLLVASLACSGIGLAFAAGAAADVFVRRKRWRRLWIAAFPIVLYGVWSTRYGSSEVTRSNIPDTPLYVIDAAAGAVAALTSLSVEWGRPLLAILVVLCAYRLVKLGRIPSGLWTTLVIALTFWTTVGLARANYQDPAASRYIYPSAVLVLLVVLELARGIRLRPHAIAVLAVATGLIAFANVGPLRDGARVIRDTTTIIPAELGALELTHGIVDPYFELTELSNEGAPVIAGFYFDAVARWGSPADSASEIARRPERARQAADAVLVNALRIQLAPGRPASAQQGSVPTLENENDVAVHRRGGCLRVRPTAGDATTDVLLPPGGIAIGARQGQSVSIALRRFAEQYTAATALKASPTGSFQILAIPRDGSERPWHARLTASEAIQLCGLPGTS